MKVKNLNEEDIEFLKELKKELNTQDNRFTAKPYFYQVQSKKFVANIHEEGNYFEAISESESIGIYEYSKEGVEKLKEVLREYDGECGENEEKMAIIEEIDLYNLDNKKLDLECYVGDFEEVYTNAFLTEKACKEHIKANKHHYRNPMDYLSYGFRNPELMKLLEILSKIEIEVE